MKLKTITIIGLSPIAALVVGGAALAVGNWYSPPRAEPPSKDTGGVHVSLTADRSSYAAGEPVKLVLTARNDGPAPATFEFSNGQRFDAVVLNPEGKHVWKWSAGKSFAETLGTLELKAGESQSFEATWDQIDGNGEPVAPGRYEVRVWLTAQALRNLATVQFDIEPEARPEPTKADTGLALPGEAQPLQQASGDLNGDGKPELIIIAGYGGSPERLSFDHLELFILEPTAPGNKVVWKSGELIGERAEPLRLRDINGDGRLEVLSVQAMGAAGQTMYVFAWLGEDYGILKPRGGHFDGQPSFGENSVRLDDVDGDGVPEVDAGYGPVASQTAVYRWDGKAYQYLMSLVSGSQQGIVTPVQEVGKPTRVVGKVVSVDLSGRFIHIAPDKGNIDTVVLQPTAQILEEKGGQVNLSDLKPHMRIEVIGSPGQENSVLAGVVAILK